VTADLNVRLLGTVEAERGGATLALGGAKQRIVLAVLALQVGRVVSSDRLVDAVWGETPSENASATLQVYVSNLRRALAGPDQKTPVIVGRRPGYVLDLAPENVDAHAFERLAVQARLQHRAGDLAAAAATMREALALWRGRPLADLSSEPFASGDIARLDEARVAAIEERIEIELALGRHRELVPELEALAADYPLREQIYAALMTALYRCGRQAEALRTFQAARTTLGDELGLDPGPELRRLEQEILRQDSALDLAAERRPDSNAVTITAGAADTAPTAWLVFPRGGRVPLGRARLVLGRSDDCDVVVPDPRASRRHAAVHGTEDGFDLIDLDSRNGTSIGTQTLTPMVATRLADGDEIVLGTTRLLFTTSRAAAERL
jgi:DNA-binding SARP family transcriptional activator